VERRRVRSWICGSRLRTLPRAATEATADIRVERIQDTAAIAERLLPATADRTARPATVEEVDTIQPRVAGIIPPRAVDTPAAVVADIPAAVVGTPEAAEATPVGAEGTAVAEAMAAIANKLGDVSL
jgi:hypothetical protein